MTAIFDPETSTKHVLDGLGGPTPVLLIKDHVQHLTNHQLESHQLVLNAKVLSDDATVDADNDCLVYILPITPTKSPTVTDDHVASLQNLITQLQTNDKALMYLEQNMDPRTIPSTFIALLLCPEQRKELLDKSAALGFIRSNTCLIKFLETLKSKPGILSAPQQDMAAMMAGLGYPPPPPGSGPSNGGARMGPQMGAGLRQGGPSQPHRITPEFLQQALAGAMRASNMTSSQPNAPPSADPNGLLAQLLNSYQEMPAQPGQSVEEQPPPQPMEGLQETINQQMSSRSEELAQLHAMGLTNDLQNIQALQATNGNVEAAIELLFNDMD